jgi:hypothetical protein
METMRYRERVQLEAASDLLHILLLRTRFYTNPEGPREHHVSTTATKCSIGWRHGRDSDNGKFDELKRPSLRDMQW